MHIIHNCVYKVIDVVKDKSIQKHHMIRKGLLKGVKRDSMD